MGILDYALILVIGAGFLAAVISMIKRHKKGGCIGCAGNCADCMKSRETKR